MGQNGLGDNVEYDYDGDWITEEVSEDFSDFDAARDTAIEVLKVLSTETTDITAVEQDRFNQYILRVVDAEDQEPTQVRPINTDLFIADVDDFRSAQGGLRFFTGHTADR